MKNNVSTDKRTQTKNAILDAAQQVFLQKGYHKTDMKDIARIVGIDKRTIYRYFKSKEALAFAVWQKVLDYIADIGKDFTGETGYERVESMLYGYMNAVKNNVNIIRFLGEFDHVFSEEYPHIEEADEFVNYIVTSENDILKCLKEGVRDKSIKNDLDVYLTGSTIVNILIALSERVVIRGEHLKVEQGYSYELLNESVKIILRGIKANNS